MNIIVLGAFGNAGRTIVAEAEKRGHHVLAVGHRKHDDITFSSELIKSTLDLTQTDVTGYDVIIDAISAWTSDTFHIHTATTSHIAQLIMGTNTRYIKVGGTGTMYISPDHTKQLKDWSAFPDNMKPLANALVDSLDRVRSYSNISWTYISPAFNFDINGSITGQYKIAGEEFALDQLIQTTISYADYATAIIDILESNAHIRERIMIYR